MSPDYHAWTHRPKEEGGTDPIIFPEAAGTPIEVAVFTSTTNWVDTPSGISLVSALDFTLTGGQYDLDTPTFSLSAASNPELNKAGAYEIDFIVFNGPNGDGTQFVSIQSRIQMIAGPAPFGLYNVGSGNSRYRTTVTPNDPNPDDVEECPLWSDKLFYMDEDFPDTAEFEFKAIGFVAGAQTADSSPIVIVQFTRLGAVWA